MASYTAAQTRGSGSLGEELPSTGIDFFITNSLNSQGNYPVGYLTLEGNATANQNLSTDAAMTGSFSNIVGGITEKSIVTSETKWSLSVFGSGGSFRFTPDSTVAANSYYIKGVGPFKLDIGPPSPPSPPGYNNQFSFEFVEGRVLEPVFTSPNNSAFDIVDEFTLSAWVRPGEKDPPLDEAIIDKSSGTIGASSGNGWSLYHDNNSTGLMSFDLKNGGTRSRLQVTNIPADDVWYHVVVTYKSSTAKMFINSIERDTLVTSFSTLGTNTNPVVVGAGSPSGTANYTGSLQNIAIFDVEFNQDEINELYNNGSPNDLNEHSRVSDGIAWWQFGGNGDSGSFDVPSSTWTELNCFNNAQYVMTSANMIEADRIQDVPPPFTNPNCFQFNGNSDSVYVAGNNTALNLTGEISISAWVTIDADVFNTGSGQKDYHIVDKYLPIGNNAEGYVLYIRRSGSGGAANTVRLRATFGATNNTTFQCTCIVDIHAGAFKLEPNTPYNIVATFNPNFNPASSAGQMKIYIDGGLAATKNINNLGTYTPASSEDFIIGNASSGPGVKEYHGKIDEVSIWDTVLSNGDVTNLQDWNVNGNLNSYSKVANLQGWYRMGENAIFNETTGEYTLKSATDTDNSNLFLTSVGVAFEDKISPGLVGTP